MKAQVKHLTFLKDISIKMRGVDQLNPDCFRASQMSNSVISDIKSLATCSFPMSQMIE